MSDAAKTQKETIMPVRLRDPNEPDFPHGTRLGYDAGCRTAFPCPATPNCSAVRRGYRDKDQTHQGAMRYQARAVREYVKKWTDKGWPVMSYAAAAEVDPYHLADIVQGKAKYVLADIARRLMAVTEDGLVQHGRLLPAYLVAWKLGSLAANGWDPEMQAAKLGRDSKTIRKIISGKRLYVSRDVYEEIEILFEWLQNTPGDSPVGRAFAAKHGFRTPDEYHPDGTLLDDLEPRDEEAGAEWNMRDHQASARLDVLLLSLRGMAAIPIETRLRRDGRDFAADDVNRFRAEAGLRFERAIKGDTTSTLLPGQEKRVQEIRAVLDLWETDPQQDPYPLVVRLGMMTGSQYAKLDNLGKPKLRAA